MEIYSANFLHKGITHTQTQVEVGKERKELSLFIRDILFDDKLKPEPELGRVSCPRHDIHTIEGIPNNLLFQLELSHLPVYVTVNEPVKLHKHMKHSHEKGAASAGRVNHSEIV